MPCDKNLVDSEVMLGLLTKHGYTLTDDETQADVIVINTCCFIHDAKEESINTILEMAQYKEQNLKASSNIMTMIASFKVFDLAYVMTEGGPAKASYVFVMHIYDYICQIKTLKLAIIVIINVKNMVGDIIGSVIRINLVHALAPSTMAAS